MGMGLVAQYTTWPCEYSLYRESVINRMSGDDGCSFATAVGPQVWEHCSTPL